MLQRILTSLIGLIVFFGVLFSNMTIFSVAIFGIIALAIYEVHHAMLSGKTILIISLISSALMLFGIMTHNFEESLILSIVIYMISSVFLHTKKSFKDIYSAAFSTIFITLFFSALITIRKYYGVFSVLLVFMIAWGTDTGAYFIGKFFGKHKLMPKVSPKKTIEGAIGGIVFSILFNFIYYAILRSRMAPSFVPETSYLEIAIFASVASVLSQLGDLASSVIKRDMDVKDFGTILPGHGGIMDRFDSVVFISPIVLYYLTFMERF